MNKKDSNQLIILNVLVLILLGLIVNTVVKMNKIKLYDNPLVAVDLNKNTTLLQSFDLYLYFNSELKIPPLNRDPFTKP